MPRMTRMELERRERERAAAMLGRQEALRSASDAGQLLAIVQRGQGLTEEATWQQLAEYVARQYGDGAEPLSLALRHLSECAKMQLLIRSLRRKEGGSLEAERLAAFQALMQEVYGGVLAVNETEGESAEASE